MQAGLGLTQMGLLSSFAGRSAFAAPTGKATKLLTIWVGGGLHWESMLCPFTSSGIAKYVAKPEGGILPYGYRAQQVENWDRSPVDLDAPGPARKLRGPILWNWDNPGDASTVIASSGGTQNHRREGYAFANPKYKLYERMAVLAGVDQGTAAHQSGIVAGMCGVAGATFRAPAVQAVVANALASKFKDRPIGNVVIGGPATVSLDLPAASSPVTLGSAAGLNPTLSDKRDSSWAGLRKRVNVPNVPLAGGAAAGDDVPATRVDASLLSALQKLQGKSVASADAQLEQLYETYKGASRTVARNVVDIISAKKGFEYLQAADPAYPWPWETCVGYSDQCGSSGSMGPYDFALQLLKSDLVTSVAMNGSSFNNIQFDTHGNARGGWQQLRVAMECVGRMMLEMMHTPGSTAGKTLFDETIVYVFSDFGRTFDTSDHHPATMAIVAGGSIIGNQLIGGFDETIAGTPLGVPVELVEESGLTAKRVPRSQDVAATVLNAFGLEPGTDFFLPGGYGVFKGVVG